MPSMPHRHRTQVIAKFVIWIITTTLIVTAICSCSNSINQQSPNETAKPSPATLSEGCYVVSRLIDYGINEYGESHQRSITNFYLDAHGNILEKEQRALDGENLGSTLGRTVCTNDEYGNVIAQEHTSFSDIGEMHVIQKWEYAYDSSGLPSDVSWQIHFDNDTPAEHATTERRSYDSGRLSNIVWPLGTCTYNGLGLIEERVYEFDANGTTHHLEYRPSYLLDEQGRPIIATFKGNSGSEVAIRLEYGPEDMVSAAYLLDTAQDTHPSEEGTLLYKLEYSWIDEPSPAVVANWSIWPRSITTYDPKFILDSILIEEDKQSLAGYADDDAQASEQQANMMDSDYRDGVYTGTGQGKEGAIEVTLSITNGLITVDSIVDPGETPGVGGAEAIADGTFKQMIETSQSAEIDGVAGATITSNGVKEAVNDALAQASGS